MEEQLTHYQKYRESILNASRRSHKAKYWSDEEYRQRKIDNASKRYYAKKAARELSEKTS